MNRFAISVSRPESEPARSYQTTDGSPPPVQAHQATDTAGPRAYQTQDVGPGAIRQAEHQTGPTELAPLAD